MFKSTWESSKECYLRAITSINFQNNKLSIKENYIRDEIKRRKLDEFFSKHEIKLCLTSPKTREKEIVLKTNLMKDVIE
jgi:3-phenylpropionate/cinnamic acid dioxygenase small subunit